MEVKNLIKKKVYGIRQGAEPIEITSIKSWIEEMELAGATHLGCESYMVAFTILTDSELLKEKIDSQESELKELKAKYEKELSQVGE